MSIEVKKINSLVLCIAIVMLFSSSLLAEESEKMETAENKITEQQPNDLESEKESLETEPETLFPRKAVREFFDEQTNKMWQYVRPYILLRTGGIFEQYDEKNQVLRRAGFQLWDAQFGFSGRLNRYQINKNWSLGINYKFTANVASGASVSDAYAKLDISSYIFSATLKLGNMKVPFMYSELESDSQMYFYDRPQYARPYGVKYAEYEIGLHRSPGATIQLGFLDKAISLEAGAFTPRNAKEESWETMIYSARVGFNSKKMMHDKVRLEVGSGFYYQEKMPQAFENKRYAFSADLRLHAFGAFIGGEWVLHEMDDAKNIQAYLDKNLENTWTRAMGYMIFAGYSFPEREYEIALRYQWYDPDDTNKISPVPQNANQALRWLTVSLSWWPIDLARLMINYTHKWELEAEPIDDTYTVNELKALDNDEVVLMLQILL